MYLLDIYCIYGILVLFWYRFNYYFFKIENGYFFGCYDGVIIFKYRREF